MAYNLYQVQMSNAWAQRCDKEQAQAERFWTQQALKNTEAMAQSMNAPSRAMSVAPSAVPTNYTSKTSYLKDRLDKLEQDLHAETCRRKKVEEELASIKAVRK